MSTIIQIHERLARLEGGQDAANEKLDDIKAALVSCDQSTEIAVVTDSLKTYKRLTWASLCVLVGAGVKSMIYGA